MRVPGKPATVPVSTFSETCRTRRAVSWSGTATGNGLSVMSRPAVCWASRNGTRIAFKSGNLAQAGTGRHDPFDQAENQENTWANAQRYRDNVGSGGRFRPESNRPVSSIDVEMAITRPTVTGAALGLVRRIRQPLPDEQSAADSGGAGGRWHEARLVGRRSGSGVGNGWCFRGSGVALGGERPEFLASQ